MAGPASDITASFLLDAWDVLASFERQLGPLHAASAAAHTADNPKAGADVPKDVLTELVIVGHRLKGTAALYGYPQLARLAELVERLFAYEAVVRAEPEQATMFLEQVSVCLAGALERIAKSGDEGPVGLDLSQLGGATLFSTLIRNNRAALARGPGPAASETGLASGPDTRRPDTGRPAASVSAERDREHDEQLVATLRRAYEDNREDWEFFAPEVAEHLDTIRNALDALADADAAQRDNAPDELIAPLFRATHTLKGAAYMMGVTPLGDLAHTLEDVIEQVRDGTLAWQASSAELFEVGCDAAARMIAVAAGEGGGLEPTLTRLEQLRARTVGDVPALLDVPDDTPDPDPSPAEPSALVAELSRFADDHPELWVAFAPEAQGYLAEVQDALATLTDYLGAAEDPDTDPDDAAYNDALDTLLRVTHTLKGSAATVGLSPVSELSRQLETVLLEVREGELSLARDVVGLLRRGYQGVRRMLSVVDPTQFVAVDTVDDAEPDTSADLDRPDLDRPNLDRFVASFQQELQATLSLASDVAPLTQEAPTTATTPSESSAGATIRVGLGRLDALLDGVGEVVSSRARLRDQYERLGDLAALLQSSRARLERTVTDFETHQLSLGRSPRMSSATPSVGPASTPTSAPTSTLTAPSAPPSRLGASIAERFDELEFDSYSDLNVLTRSVAEMASDLNEVQGQLNRLLRAFGEETEQLQGLSRRLRRDLSRARMVPVGQLFRRLRRLLSQAPEEKSYRLELSGEGVDIDKLVLEDVLDPLLQIVRNALVHGIEPRSERRRLGKDLEGVVSLRASHQGNHVYLEVADDGAGLDIAAIRAQAQRRGLRDADELAALSDAEAQQLIFLPGLSTAPEITTAAGRGVGMDVVAERLRRLKGDIAIDSTPGVGTRFTLRLPLTLLISEALMVGVGGQRFAIGVEALQTLRYVDVEGDDVGGDDVGGDDPNTGTEDGRGPTTLRVEDETVPLYYLDRLLGLPTLATGPRPVAVLRSPGGRFALAVDELGDIEEVVIRGLDPVLTQLGYLTGATVSSQGDVIVLLDPVGVRALASGAAATPSLVSAPAPAAKTRVLLVDDSLSVRRIVGRMLSRAGYEVITAADGQAALERLQQGERVDAVLTDLEMPRLNGYELVEQLRRYPVTAALPIAVITTRSGEKHSDLAFELGADDYLSKPVDDTRLLAVLDNLLGAERGARRVTGSATYPDVRSDIIDTDPTDTDLAPNDVTREG
ncbi:MAG: Hpt domain-containing protein [Trueperaceae bacterium]|nr:Hpt domain-containing protein [Trueperaceae bacterium]